MEEVSSTQTIPLFTHNPFSPAKGLGHHAAPQNRKPLDNDCATATMGCGHCCALYLLGVGNGTLGSLFSLPKVARKQPPSLPAGVSHAEEGA